jgi:molybdopterin synthase catalytic subunit
VSSVANAFCEILVTREPLSSRTPVFSGTAGAVVEFWGVVRDREGTEPIQAIDYEAHIPMAEHQLRQIVEEAQTHFTFESIVLHHRIGWVPVGEPSLWVCLGAKHRAEAFAACQWVIDRLKERVPIWKHPAMVGPSPS